MLATKKNFWQSASIFLLASTHYFASRPMALPLPKPVQKPFLRAVSMCTMERRWNSCASTGSQKRHWPYTAVPLTTAWPEIETRPRRHPMCQFDPNLCPAGIWMEKKIYQLYLPQFRIASPRKVRHLSSWSQLGPQRSDEAGPDTWTDCPSMETKQLRKHICPPSNLVCPFLSSVVPGAHQTCHGKPLSKRSWGAPRRKPHSLARNSGPHWLSWSLSLIPLQLVEPSSFFLRFTRGSPSMEDRSAAVRWPAARPNSDKSCSSLLHNQCLFGVVVDRLVA